VTLRHANNVQSQRPDRGTLIKNGKEVVKFLVKGFTLTQAPLKTPAMVDVNSGPLLLMIMLITVGVYS
jgi:hypothetical protein